MTTFESAGREIKAAKIADWLLGKTFTAAEVSTGLDDDVAWKLLADELGMKIASAKTRALVVEQMERAEMLWTGEGVAS